MTEDIVPGLSPVLNSSLEEFKVTWRGTLENQFGALMDSLFSGEDCVFVSMEHILRHPRQERHLSIFELLEEQEQYGGT